MAKGDVSVEPELDIKEPIIVSVSAYRGVRRLDIRHYYRDDFGDLKPSKKGVQVPFELHQVLLEAIVEAIKQAGGTVDPDPDPAEALEDDRDSDD